MVSECAAFDALHYRDIEMMGPSETSGDAFYLARNGLPSGYWAMGRAEQGGRLTAAARALGPFTLRVGDDGQLHAAQEATLRSA